MALQKRRRGPATTRHQRSAWMKRSGENRPQTQACPSCGAPRIAHRICLQCGTYGGKTIIAQQAETE